MSGLCSLFSTHIHFSCLFFRYLHKVNANLETLQKVQKQRIMERTHDLFALIVKAKIEMMKEYR